jgi:3-hydroxyisobutyrate dehydrogenase-like beta-hydroxyacid dehydrogenase
MAPQLLFIGLGNMGRAMAKNIAEKGSLESPLLIFNRTPSRATDLASTLSSPSSVEVVPSPDALPSAIERADIVFSIVTNDAAVEELYTSILSSGVDLAGKTFVECSTVAPATADKIGERVTAAGGIYVASPVFGAPAAAQAAKLIFLPAGPAAAIEALRPFVDGIMGYIKIPFPDATPGTALKLKLVGNACILNMVTQLSESLALAEQSGIGSAPFSQFIDLMFGGVYSLYAKRMTEGTYWKDKPLFSANGGIKDATHVLNLGKSVGVDMKNIETVRGYLQQVKEHSDGDNEDIAGIYGTIRESAGLKFENDV